MSMSYIQEKGESIKVIGGRIEKNARVYQELESKSQSNKFILDELETQILSLKGIIKAIEREIQAEK
ncbi:MAG: hypothetical protein U9N10_00695 [Bacillota bacterium]|nr:hypothetical protein [Bacillota bacterium]